MSKQDILNAFREVLNKAKTFDEMQSDAEHWLLNALTEFEREKEKEIIEKIKFYGEGDGYTTLQVASILEYELSQLEKEKRT